MIKKLALFIALLCASAMVFAQVTVTFKINTMPVFKTSAKNIYMAGNFNNWNPADNAWQMQSDNGIYQLVKSLPAGNYDFKVTKGSWQTGECGAAGGYMDNRSLHLVHDTTILITIADWQDNYPVAEKKHTASVNVHIISEKFDMPQLNRQRRVWIYLPSDYATNNKKYPVIYMHDGQNLFDAFTSGFGEWGVDELMDKMPANKQCIIVGIDHGGDNRFMEYNPYDSKYGKGRGDDYVDFLAKTLKPYIDAHYHTLKDARHTTIAGSSMGGLISMYAVLKYPGVFGNGGIFSPAFWIAPPMFDYALKQKVSNRSRFYFVCGDSEDDTMVTNMQKMANTMLAKGINKLNAPVVVIKGAKHNELQWNGDFPAFYNWLISGY